MTQEIFQRTELLIGSDGLKKLAGSHVLIIGVGGVGAFAAEFIARAGVGKITIADGDEVAESNCNRQLLALHSTLHKRKTAVMKQRLLDVNPDLQVVEIDKFIGVEDLSELLTCGKIDFVVDAIDSVGVKCALIVACQNHNLPIVSSMGAAGRLAPEKIKIAKLSKTNYCMLAKAVRSGVKKLGGHLETLAVYSDEDIRENMSQLATFTDVGGGKRVVPGTISYLPAAFGGMCASVCIRHLLEKSV